jgi:hypothetical protein
MAAYRRQSSRAKELKKSALGLDEAHDKRQVHLAEIDRQLAEAADTERVIAQSQPKSSQLGEVRAIQEKLRKQKEELAAYDRAQEPARKRLLDEAIQAGRCADEIASKRQEMRQGAVEDSRGTVEWRQAGLRKDWIAPKGEVVLHPGDAIRTGADGHVRLRLPDGSVLELGPSAGFALSADPDVLGEQISGSILYKIQGFLERLRKLEVHTPSAVTSVRGTEFFLQTSSGAATRLTAVDGKVEFTARPVPMEASRQAAWWAQKSPSASPVTPKVNDLIKSGVSTIALELSGGFTAQLAPGSVLQVRQDKEGRPLYGLWRGRLYARRTAKAGGPEPVFTSPTAVCAVRGTEFEYHVPEGKPPEFIIYDGAIEVTADQKRFQDPGLFRAWWEE